LCVLDHLTETTDRLLANNLFADRLFADYLLAEKRSEALVNWQHFHRLHQLIYRLIKDLLASVGIVALSKRLGNNINNIDTLVGRV